MPDPSLPMNEQLPQDAIILTGGTPYTCPGCGETIGRVFRVNNQAILLSSAVFWLHGRPVGYCLWCRQPVRF